VKSEKLEPFVIADDQQSDADKPKPQEADLTAIKNVASQIQPGEVSDFFPQQDGGVIVVLEKRDPPDPAKYQQNKAAFDELYLRNKREIVFYEWLRDRQLEAGVEFSPAKS
jgi:hypothetical protein